MAKKGSKSKSFELLLFWKLHVYVISFSQIGELKQEQLLKLIDKDSYSYNGEIVYKLEL